MVRILLSTYVLLLAGCDGFPKDPNNTLKNIQSRGVLHVGVIEHNPWAFRSGTVPQGIEVAIVSDFAKLINVQPDWKFLSEAEAVEKLKNRELDIVIGGLAEDSPRKKELGFTRPYKGQHVMAAPQGENEFITTLEKFLAAHKHSIQQFLKEKNNEAGSTI